MKSQIYLALAVFSALTLSACGNQKSQRIPITRGGPGTAAQQKEMASFQARGGCLNLEAVVDFYKNAKAPQLARISVRDIVISKQQSTALLPALLKARPIEIQIDAPAIVSESFPLQVVKQTDCTSVEILDENGKSQTLQIIKNREVSASAARPEATRPRPTDKPRQQATGKVQRGLPTAIAQKEVSAYLPNTLLLQAPNGEKWVYRFNVSSKSLEISFYRTLGEVKGCASLKGTRVQEIYDVALLSNNKSDSIRVSSDILDALKTLGTYVPEKTDSKKAAKSGTQQKPRRKMNNDLQKTFQMMSTDQYIFIAKQLASDKIKAPACGGN